MRDLPDGPGTESSLRRTLLRTGVVAGIGLAVIPAIIALLGIGRASHDVAEGLRGATQREDKRSQVAFALSSTSIAAILAPIGVLLGVSCGLGLVGDRRRPPHDED